MRTAEEILSEKSPLSDLWVSRDEAIEAMIQMAREACYTQRISCKNVAMKSNIYDIDKNILKAPLPELKY